MSLLPLLTGVITVIFIIYLISAKINSVDPGTERMREIAGYINEGAIAFLRREYTYVSFFSLALFLAVGFGISWSTAIAFALGTILSASTGLIGMLTSTRANVRTASSAMTGGMNKALSVAFSGGAVMGLSVVGFGYFGLGILSTF